MYRNVEIQGKNHDIFRCKNMSTQEVHMRQTQKGVLICSMQGKARYNIDVSFLLNSGRIFQDLYRVNSFLLQS